MSTLKEANRLSGAFDSRKYDIEDLLFKVLVIGDFGVGVFNPGYMITIGVDFALKHLVWDSNKHITLQLWDIAGHERFGYMTRVYYKYATAAVIVYDLSSSFCQEHGFAGWFPTSAKEDININEAMRCLVAEVLAQREEGNVASPRDQSLKRLGIRTTQPSKKSCCRS
ncbi:hypothetical protein V5799_008480 [Amblyomma americanum]|uniref:Uncharacterized protein n=1 Tax=Amblyomma americanum TaxID=6943 RepID=A0AAQ4FEL2_AMBAM